MSVDSSYIGAGWIISQLISTGEHPVLFGSVTFKPHESRYSQPKLELYGLYRAVKAERHRVYGIHFRIKVDARSLIEMVNKPDLPNSPLNRWLAMIQLFDYEIVYNPAEKHRGPDGLSRRRHSDDDSEDSDSEMDAEDENKFLKSSSHVYEVSNLTLEAHATEEDLNVTKLLCDSRLDRKLGECLALEVEWNSTVPLRSSGYRNTFEGEAEVAADDSEGVAHAHHKQDFDSEEYWDQILAYLVHMQEPSDLDQARRIKNRAKSFFMLDGVLWRRNRDKMPLQVVLSHERRLKLVEQAHDDSGHRGRDPTFKKLSDSFWFPNMYQFVRQYCRSCHECQMRSTYRDRIPIQPTYVRTILRDFGADTVHMPKGKYGLRYIIDMHDKFSGFLEAKAIIQANSKTIAAFLFDVMCRYGCFPRITTDNGSEFKKAVILLADKYKIPIILISAYNAEANGLIERVR